MKKKRIFLVFFNYRNNLSKDINSSAITIINIILLNTSKIDIDAGVNLNTVITKFIIAITAL
jgi:hypothetical protein